MALSVGAGVGIYAAQTILRLPCPFHLLTGLDCPGCGATRAMIDLARGDMAQAMDHNALVVLGAPAVLIMLAWRWRPSAGRAPAERTTPGTFAVISTLLVLVGWAVARNIPALSWLQSGS